MRRLMPSGRASGCRRKRDGDSRRAARKATSIRGATNGGLISPTSVKIKTTSASSRPWGNIRAAPALLARSIWRATPGSGQRAPIRLIPAASCRIRQPNIPIRKLFAAAPMLARLIAPERQHGVAGLRHAMTGRRTLRLIMGRSASAVSKTSDNQEPGSCETILLYDHTIPSPTPDSPGAGRAFFGPGAGARQRSLAAAAKTETHAHGETQGQRDAQAKHEQSCAGELLSRTGEY